MLDIHERIHRLRTTGTTSDSGDIIPYRGDPIPLIARQLAQDTPIICFDEFQVTDVADALIMRRLFEALFDSGTVVVATSNRSPQDLYLGGINRESFLPFISILEERCDVMDMDAAGAKRDFRLLDVGTQDGCNDELPLTSPPSNAAPKTFISPLGPETDAQIKNVFKEFGQGSPVTTACITVAYGRTLTVNKVRGTTASFTFFDLFSRPLGAADYLAICEAFDTVVICDMVGACAPG